MRFANSLPHDGWWTMRRPCRLALVGIVWLGLTALGIGLLEAAEPQVDEAFFENKIRPVLAGVCFRCHGGGKVGGELRVDSAAALAKGGESGPAIVAGAPDESLLMKAVRRADGVSAMPPDKPLRPDQVEDLARWIKAGARWPAKVAQFQAERHWAFEPLKPVPVPTPRDAGWVRTSVDSFIRARQETQGVAPAPPADRRTLLRRATFDLTGLPPAPAEVRAFEEDTSPRAFDTVLERLLESPHYGEHWGRHWLDVVRYADTAGENSDHPLPHAWRYRNWVIQAFNENLPFDQFIRLQIAGDLLAAEGPADKYADRVIATGYLAIARRFGHDIDKDMHLTYEDTIDTIGKSILGLTLGCTRCHDHKFDPLTARDYYGLYGILESTKFSFPGCEPKQQPRDLVPLDGSPDFARQLQPLRDRIAQLDVQLKDQSAQTPAAAKSLKELAQRNATVLAAADVDDGGERTLTAGAKVPLERVDVKRGDVLLLSITPRGNHGADSTLVEWSINELGEKARRWSLADLVADLPAGNPHPDTHGNAATWCFLDAREGYQFLPERLEAIDGRAALKAWRNGDTPSVFVNTSDQPVKVWTDLPARTFFAHPGPQGPVAIAWLAPIDGAVTIAGRVADAHRGGDGVGFVLEKFTSSEDAPLAAAFAKQGEQGQNLQRLTRERAELAAKLVIPVAYAVTEGTAKHARIHKRGEPNDLGDEQPRKFLDVLGGQLVTNTAASGRRELADWLTSPTNPLTARVFANRVWQWHFGTGLVKTPNDFGTRGAAPTHPELLDHLANELIKSGWNIKALHRLIMQSATYQQSALAAATGDATPPAADLLATFPRRRLSAEELRDTLLTVTGELDRTPGAAHPFPPEATWSFSQHAPFAAEYDTLKRSVYVMQKRNRRTRFFALFDGADPNASTPVRDVTTVPTQALFFMNDPLVHGRAEKLAEMMSAEKDPLTPADVVWKLLGRSATAEELADAESFLRDYGASLPGNVDNAQRLRRARAAWVRVQLSGNEFLYID